MCLKCLAARNKRIMFDWLIRHTSLEYAYHVDNKDLVSYIGPELQKALENPGKERK